MQRLAELFIRGLEIAFPPTLQSLGSERISSAVVWTGGIQEEDLDSAVVGSARPRTYKNRLHRMAVEGEWEGVT